MQSQPSLGSNQRRRWRLLATGLAPRSRFRTEGVALVIVLCFVVLLTGVVLAFFSRSINELQISNQSVEQVRVDLLGQAAIDTTIGDLKQEIAAGSKPPSVASNTQFTSNNGTSTTTTSIYLPNSPTDWVPALSGVPTNGASSLIKRSASGIYPNDANGTGRAANVPSTMPALNARYVSLARWNSHLLLPKKDQTNTNDTDFTPDLTAFTAPDWVIVTRAGKNVPGTALPAANKLNGADPVAGRYAFAIYDEGSLLDMNAAGYPSVITPGTTPYTPGYKNSLAFADLQQLPGIKDLVASNSTRANAIIDNIIGFRSYASAGWALASASPASSPTFSALGNIFPNFTWSPTNAANYYNNFAAFNTSGFLTATNLPVQTTSLRATDHPFLSRQEFMQVLLSYITTSKSDRALLENALPYLGTFSRDLNQPAYIPAHIRDSNAPVVQTLALGGNYEGPGKDDQINPFFLGVRNTTTTAGARLDGSDLVQGEPLVKKRFPLNRLAWLTYKGPSQGRTATDPDIVDLKTNFGFTQAFLNLGTKKMVQDSFGLTWNNGYWTYDVHASSTGIRVLNDGSPNDVVHQNREPDFIELLKAAVTAGALGKSGAQSTGSGDTSPKAVQFNRDSSIDCQVIQLAANIIDQFDVDGFPTRIQFPAYAREFRGVENLPYLYRLRNGLYRIVNPTTVPAIPSGPSSVADWFAGTVAAGGSGTFVMVQQPEIWNPHAYDATSAATINRSLGNPRPQNLQLVVYGGAPALPPAVPAPGSAVSVNPRWQGKDIGPTLVGQVLSDATTKMTFNNGDSLYREPTLLIKPNVPAGSNLQAPGFVAAATADGLSPSGGGIQVLDSAAIAYGGAEPGSAGLYCGVYLGKNVVAYPGNNTASPPVMGIRVAGQAHLISPAALTYQVQCDSSTGSGMDIYDEKYFTPDSFTDGLPTGRGMMGVSPTDPNTYSGRLIIGANRIMTCFDPRTSRFGIMRSTTGDVTNYQSREFPPGVRSPGFPVWVDKTNNVLPSNRPDTNAGYGFAAPSDAPPSLSSPPVLGWNWTSAGNQLLRFGLFSQNSRTSPDNNLRFKGDSTVNSISDTSAQYYADADGIVRRAMGANVTSSGGAPASTFTGLPMATAYYAPVDNPSSPAAARQKESRPIILNHPFRTVGELGCVFSDTPWRNVDFSTPESGYAALLDVFCINDTDDANGLVAGKVNLNTRQTSVVQAILSGASKNEYYNASPPGNADNVEKQTPPLTPGPTGEANTIATALLARTGSTTTNKGPLSNLAELTGSWKSGTGTSAVYDGFSADLTSTDPFTNNIPRYREGAIRALAAVGNTRVWNLMIDVVAQTGRYPQSASSLDKFVVEGEQRYWVHVAIDRYTGQIIDKQIEVVKE